MSYVHPEYLVEPSALAAMLGADDLKIFDVSVHLRPAEKGYRPESGKADYDAGHIPGAAFLDQIRAVSDTSTGLGFSVPSPEMLEAALGDAGINDGDRVVVYSSAHMMWATRAWWLLRYAGIEEVAVLNGGFRAWQAEDFEVATDVFRYDAGSLNVQPRDELFVSQDEVLAAIGDEQICTVNALAADVYSGAATMSYGRKGHISGSINLPYDDLLENGRYRSAAELATSLSTKGLLDSDRVIAYCGGGISATIDALACVLVGKDAVAVYDGSMSEWVRDDALPMTLGDLPG